MSQPTQLDSCSVQKQELQLGPNPVEHKIQTLKPKNGSLMYDIYGKAPNLQFGLHNGGHEQMSMPSSSKTVSYPDAVLGRPVIGSTNLNAPPEKAEISLPTVEVRFENLTIEAKCYIGNKALPTMLNSARNLAEFALGMVGIMIAKRTTLIILKDASGIIHPSRKDYSFT